MGTKGECGLQINLQKLWVTLGSIMVSLTFVFGNNMRSIYEAVVYLFVVHPYDVGDAVLCGPNQDWCTVRSCTNDVLHQRPPLCQSAQSFRFPCIATVVAHEPSPQTHASVLCNAPDL